MSLPQIKGSFVSNQAEANIAAASVRIDFALVKVQPHDEYQDVGRSLSARRKNEADEGQSHLTAVQLGLLFGGLVPKVPNLIRAFGLRCSELAKSPIFNPQATSQHGLFANEVGLDGTSVWAAATSGDAAIAVLLLACMLSRMWDPPAAISIWMQLISERKRVLAASGNPLDCVASSKVSLTRDQIASWHTSTHAWRLTADEANARRQNQLLLIINNLGIPVNTKLSLSESVINAWQSAMLTVDQLVAGIPQSVQTGAPLLGLSAWHLYPNMVVYCPGKYGKPIDILQHDPLVKPSGIMTLGIQDIRRRGDGIYWSLPLAHLRYYGQPIQSEALLSSRTSRFSIDDLTLVALGSIIRRWCASTTDIDLALKILIQFDELVDIPGGLWGAWSWLSLLASAARSFLDAESNIRADKLPFIRCGQRRYPLFVDDPKSDSIFGLSAPSTLLRLIPGNAERVRLLRHVAQDFGEHRFLMIIQCKTGCPNSTWELSSVERLRSRHKRILDNESAVHSAWRYFRWLNRLHVDPTELDIQPDSDSIRLDVPIPCFWAPHGYQWQNAPRAFYSNILEQTCVDNDWRRARGVTIRSLLAFGDPDVAALYCLDISYWTQFTLNYLPRTVRDKYRPLPNIFVAKHISWALEERLPSSESLFSHLEEGKFSEKMLRSFKALLSVSTLYKDLSNATVELKVAEKPLYKHAWIPTNNQGHRYHSFGGFQLNREEMFACIARFESGSFNLDPSAMSRVLAISNGNSIYVARCLLQDSCAPRSSTAIERIVGNFGKTGMAFLICPDIPDVRPESGDPQLVPHLPFDGGEEDCFSQTSLHLSFTGWEQEIPVGSSGNRDVEASYVEAAIKLYDHGKWVADLNILDVFKHRFSRMMPECEQHRESRIPREELCKLVSIDSWEELLDSPIEIGVIRARGNWQARLAAAALAVQRGHETRIIPEHVCWTCYLSLEKLPCRSIKADDNVYEDDEVFGAFPYYDEDDSDSETEDIVQAAMREDEKRDSQIRDPQRKETDKVSNNDRSDRNIIYIF